MKKKWWHNKIAYQIYPKSFYDSNNDGIGDIKGIIQRLDYLKTLGVDIIWLSPIYPSPFADQGYDISDYYGIDPQFGTMEDMDKLILEAKKRDMYILLDLVVNHCSDEHSWFKEAIKDPSGKYGNFFYIEDKKDKLPSNLRSYFGGSVWEDLPENPDKIYFHAFHKKQPDLNWENKEVRDEIYKNINWWLDKGLGGFRIDAIINIKKVLPFKDYTVNRENCLASIDQMLDEAEGVGEFLSEMRDKTFAPHDAFTVGEVFNEKEDEIPDFIGDNGYFSSMFDFSTHLAGKSTKGWYDNKDINWEMYKKALFDAQKLVGETGFLSTIIENHDEPRGVSYYIPKEALSNKSKKALGIIYFFLRGIPFIYQGQEIGMENITVSSIDEVDDISARDEYEVSLKAGLSKEEAISVLNKFSRDNARTPVQWDNSENAGFTKGTPWLKVNPNYKNINVKAQENDKDSVLNFYRKMCSLRKNKEYEMTFVYGKFKPFMEEEKDLISYFRNGDKNLLVIGNFSKEIKEIKLTSEINKILLSNDNINYHNNKIILNSYDCAVLELK